MSLSSGAAVLNALALTIGVILVVGAYRHWSWLVDPPIQWAPYYSQAWLKKILGTRVVVIWTYFVGLVLIATPLLAIWAR